MPAMLSRSIVVFSVAVASLAAPALARTGYYTGPDIHGDLIVFSSEGDLWTVSAAGGIARRLTSHPGGETKPRFSPDGKRIAFLAVYDGNPDVFVIPVEGGEPHRLTYNGGPDDPVGWTPDGKNIIFRTGSYHPHSNYELFTIPADGGDFEKLPLGWASYIDVDPTSGLWAFNRNPWETNTWKRYRGGEAPEIWVGHPDRQDFKNVTNFPGIDLFPMWHGGRLYYLSDRGGTANLWTMAADGSDRKQLTFEKSWDVRWPNMGPEGRIAFTLAGDVHVLDVGSGTEHEVSIELPSEHVLARKRYPASEQFVTEFALAPEGDRLAVVARGEVFSLPVFDPSEERNGNSTKGVVLQVTHGSGAREHGIGYSGDGKRLAYITDASGEEAIVTTDAWGRGEDATIVPAASSGWHFPPNWSPNGKWIAYSDQTYALYVVSADGGTPVLVDRATNWEISNYTWSPDGRYLAYVTAARTDYRSIYVYDTQTKQKHEVTTGSTDDFSPAWDPNGDALYFLSNRTAAPAISFDTYDMNHVIPKPTLVYMALLRADVKNPFLPSAGLPGADDDTKDGDKKDKAKDGGKSKGKDEGKDESKDEEVKPITIDFDGLAQRIIQLPVDAGRYGGLGATKKRLFFFSQSLAPETDEGPTGATLLSLNLETRETEPFVENITGYDLAWKKDRIAVLTADRTLAVLDANSKPEDVSKKAVSLGDVVIELDPAEEWTQMYREAWRVMRDFYWDANMAGLDWRAIGDQYATLLPRIGTLGELNDVIGQLIGELSTSHTYIYGGDPGTSVPQRPTGVLGADVKREGTAFRVTRIYRGDAADRDRSPLEEPGVDVREGEYLQGIDHRPFPPNEAFGAAFENRASKPVVLTISDRAMGGKTRDVVVTPLASDHRLRYIDWVRRNREYVTEKTGGKIGYLHIPDMGIGGLTEFERWFYPQLDKEGFVIDVRWNAGGFVSQLILDRVARRPLTFDVQRYGAQSTYPYRAVNGPLVVLVNEFAGSDGDIFPYQVQREGLGPVIGMRSWGGVVGIRGDKPRVDGGMVTQPEFALWDARKGWAVENHGVDPDIVIDDTPQEIARGVDAQLDRAIQEVMRLHDEHPPIRIEPGPKPTKRREDYHNE